jgi:hypothetical protein
VVRARALVRTSRHQYWPKWAGLAWLGIGLLALLSTAGCNAGVEIERLNAGQAVISGTVRGSDKDAPVEGRAVDVVNVDTNETQRLTTDNAGGFRLAVRPGKYRVQLSLRDGESLLQAPGVMTVAPDHADAHADFVVGITRVSRPRTPAYRSADGLGSPIA